MKAIHAIAVAIACLACTPASAQTNSEIKSFCSRISESMRDVQNQLPMDVDFLTKLIGVTVIYANGKCTLTYKQVLNERKYAAVLAKDSGGLPVSVLLSPEMRDALADFFISGLPKSLRDLAAMPFMEVVYDVRFDEGINQPLIIRVPKY